MKVSFPYMGCVTGYKKLFELLGHEVITPRKPTQRTVDLGVLNSPEFICYPFKVMLGTYIEACEDGAEIIISSGGSGPCRAGLYGDLHKKILRQLGYNIDVVIFDSMFEDFGAFFKKLLVVKNKTPIIKAPFIAAVVVKLINQMDNMEKFIKHKRPYEINRNEFNRCFDKIKIMYDKCFTLKQLKETRQKAWSMLNRIPTCNIPDDERLKIGIVGEIYVIMESTTNMDIEQRINDLGAEVSNIQYISDWLKHNAVPKKINKAESWKMWKKAEQYKVCNCGGHDMENTGAIIDFAKKGYDGVIHLMPFGCLPELVTRSIIPQISEDYDLPILSMSIDEQQGYANVQTRLEAFLELCKSKKGGETERYAVSL